MARIAKIAKWLDDNTAVICTAAVKNRLLSDASDGDYLYYRRYKEPGYFLFGLMLRQPKLTTALLRRMVSKLVDDSTRHGQRALAQVKLLSGSSGDHMVALSLGLLVNKHLKASGSNVSLMRWLRSSVPYSTWIAGFGSEG